MSKLIRVTLKNIDQHHIAWTTYRMYKSATQQAMLQRTKAGLPKTCTYSKQSMITKIKNYVLR